jgi:hypothetical protein
MAVTAPAVPTSGIGNAVPNQTGQNVDVAVTGGTITGILVFPPASLAPAVATPAVPASTVTATNPNPFPVFVAVTGGTVTVISVGGSATGLTSGTVIVPAGATVAVTYSAAPTWAWSAAVAGFTGTSIPSPSSVPLPPACTLALVYSVAPTMAWTDPINETWEGYAQSDLTAINQAGDLPWAPHAEGGETGLGFGVSN